jgi:hypothetical protein
MHYFIYLLLLLVSGRYHLDAVDFNNLQDLEVEEFEQQAGEEGKCFLTMLNYALSLSSYIITHMH